MKKTLMLALALGVLAGCADDTADVVDTDTTVVEPAAPVTEPTDDLMEDPLMDEPMDDGAMMEGDAGLDEMDDADGVMEDETMVIE